jgi:hypothetical protein
MLNSSDRFLNRPFRLADREPLDELWSRVFPDDPTWNAPAVMIENKLKVQPELLLIGELDGTIVGALMAGFDGVRGWLYHLAVGARVSAAWIRHWLGTGGGGSLT